MILFSVSALDKSPVTLEGEESIEFLDLGEDDQLTVVAPMSYKLSAGKVSGGVLVKGCAATAVNGICGRCLEEVTQEVTADVELFFDVADNQEELDVSEDIRAEMLLALPMNLLCSDDCAGLCRNCGGNINKDECTCEEPNRSGGDFRWSALDDIKL